MQFGAVFPQTEIGTDPAVIRTYAQQVEAMGYQHILVYDHVLGAGTASRPDWDGPYTSETPFHEPMVLFGYLAAVTEHIELVSGVLILPQRQTALVAKQAAEVDILSGGRLRLGVGIGWNSVEYEGLNEAFATRAARIEEQVDVLRALWRDHAITFAGRWHHVADAGLNPLPPRRSIPIWFGGSVEATLQRVARFGDGWFPQMGPTPHAREMMAHLHNYIRQAGRDPASVGIEARLSIGRTPEQEWGAYVDGWRALGATHMGVNTMGAGLASPEEHIAALRQVKAVLDL
jgi:probable F420-dependent oxidoreductase